MSKPTSSDAMLFINGKSVASGTGIDIFNPATGKVFAIAHAASDTHLNLTVEAAKSASRTWAGVDHSVRQEAVQKLALILRDNIEELANLLVLEQGKPIEQAQQEINIAAQFLDYFCSLPLPHKPLSAIPEQDTQIYYRPLGVVAAIVPWNFPILLTAFKIGPALVSGNSVIVKSAPTTPLTTLRIAHLSANVFPAGVFNVLTGGNDLGAAMTRHPGIQKVAFTGSTETGKKVMASAATNLKRLTLELGGNDPAIVLKDADIPATAQGIFGAAFLNAGQTCMAIKRVYVHSSIYDALITELAKCIRSATVGPGNDPKTTIGPLQNKKQHTQLMDLLNRSVTPAANIISGNCPESTGYFIRPCLVSNIEDENPIVTEEQFGPILPILPFETEDEVIKRANISEYGLGASVWSSDSGKALNLAKRIESGTVWINQHLSLLPNVPLGGIKQSGIGHELGEDVLEHFMSAQVIMRPRVTNPT